MAFKDISILFFSKNSKIASVSTWTFFLLWQNCYLRILSNGVIERCWNTHIRKWRKNTNVKYFSISNSKTVFTFTNGNFFTISSFAKVEKKRFWFWVSKWYLSSGRFTKCFSKQASGLVPCNEAIFLTWFCLGLVCLASRPLLKGWLK